MKTKATVASTLVLGMLISVSAGRATDAVQVRTYPDPGYRLMGSYRGHSFTDYVSHGSLGLAETFPRKKQWWSDRKAAHEAGRLHKYEILGVYYGVGPGYRFEEGLTLDKIKARFDAWLKPEPGVPTYPELIPAITLSEENAGCQFAMAQDWRTRVGLILRYFGFRGVDGFVLLWRHVVQGLVDALTIIKRFDVLEHA